MNVFKKMLPKERDSGRLDDWEKRIRYITLPIIWLSLFISGALAAYAGIQQEKCTETIHDFNLLYNLSLSTIPASVVLLFYILNLYGFLMVMDNWFRISSTIFHLMLYTYYGVLIAMLCILLNHHLETDYNDSNCLEKYNQLHQTNAAWGAVSLCVFAMALIQATPWREYEK